MALVLSGDGTVTGLAVGGLPDGTVDSGTIATGTIVDADINASAAIAGSKLTGVGEVVQVVHVTDGSHATGTTAMPFDDTTPQKTEGTEWMTLAITPQSATNILLISVVLCQGTGADNANHTVALFQDTTDNALATMTEYQTTSYSIHNFSFTHKMAAGTTSATTFKVRGGIPNTTTTFINGDASAKLNGTIASSITIMEITP